MRHLLLAAALAVAGCGDSEGPRVAAEVAPPDPATVAFEPGPALMRRLTAAQYEAVVADLFGADVVPPARLEPDSRAGGSLALGATVTAVSERGVELYGDAAFALAGQVLAAERRARWVACGAAISEGVIRDDDCAGETLRRLGRRAWRRPLSEEEVARLVAIAGRAAETVGDFYAGLEFGVAAVLASPHFVYRVEVAGPEDPGSLDAFALASRLSFLLWNTGPDDALLDAAAAGRLGSDEGLRVEVERLVGDERVRAGVRAFFGDLFELDRLDALSKAPELFPHFDETLGPAAREETLGGIERWVVDERGDYREVMTSRRAWVDAKLASVYRVRAAVREGFGAVELPADGARVGLLGQVSVLALQSHPVSTSATLRGKFVREALLCQVIPDPPAGVDTSIPAPSGRAPTLRDRIEEHLESPACAGCHRVTDGIGLGLEHFDGIGRFRASDNGAVIDARGDLDGVAFDGPVELAAAIAAHPRFGPCLVERLYRYGIGREPGAGDEAMLDALALRFAADGHDVLGAMVELAMSPAFRRVGGGE